ncbi:unnamed protein product [Echinostoma caproni]|uniref:GLTP domain-containing protein n=1 Tax=Echinostoma caproni TaxID=27848 RepID=A0A183AKE0_9TREM|nr:unnamed protein product [Echinostoma caproni]
MTIHNSEVSTLAYAAQPNMQLPSHAESVITDVQQRPELILGVESKRGTPQRVNEITGTLNAACSTFLTTVDELLSLCQAQQPGHRRLLGSGTGSINLAPNTTVPTFCSSTSTPQFDRNFALQTRLNTLQPPVSPSLPRRLVGFSTSENGDVQSWFADSSLQFTLTDPLVATSIAQVVGRRGHRENRICKTFFSTMEFNRLHCSPNYHGNGPTIMKVILAIADIANTVLQLWRERKNRGPPELRVRPLINPGLHTHSHPENPANTLDHSMQVPNSVPQPVVQSTKASLSKKLMVADREGVGHDTTSNPIGFLHRQYLDCCYTTAQGFLSKFSELNFRLISGENTADDSKLPGDYLSALDFTRACRSLFRLLDRFVCPVPESNITGDSVEAGSGGNASGFTALQQVRTDLQNNVDRLELAAYMYADQQSGAETGQLDKSSVPSVNDNIVAKRAEQVTIGSLVRRDQANGTTTDPGSVYLAILWLARNVTEYPSGTNMPLFDDSLGVVATEAYSRCLRSFHQWALRGVAMIVIKSLPSRNQFLRSLFADSLADSGLPNSDLIIQPEIYAQLQEDSRQFSGALGRTLTLIEGLLACLDLERVFTGSETY